MSDNAKLAREWLEQIKPNRYTFSRDVNLIDSLTALLDCVQQQEHDDSAESWNAILDQKNAEWERVVRDVRGNFSTSSEEACDEILERMGVHDDGTH